MASQKLPGPGSRLVGDRLESQRGEQP